MVNSDLMMKRIHNIAKISSRNKKISYITTGMKPILYYTYHPDFRYYLKAPKDVVGRGVSRFDNYTYKLLNLLSRRTIGGNAAKKLVAEYIQSLTPLSGELFKRILNKNLKCGVNAKLVNQVFPDFLPEDYVMLAQEYKEGRIDYPCYASPKYDGMRAVFFEGEFYSRRWKVIPGLPHLKRKLRSVKAPALDGELMVPGYDTAEANGLLRAKTTTPGAVYCVFDLFRYPAPLRLRLQILQTLFDNKDFGSVTLIPHVTLHSHEQIRNYYNMCRAQGFEGAMVKAMNSEYKRKRSKAWLKIKDVRDADLICTDMFEGNGKYIGMMGGIVVNFKGKDVEVGSGFTDEDREDFWQNPEKIIGHTVEVAYQEVTSKGSLRNPRFLRLRADKD